MIDFTINPELKFIRFDENDETHAEITAVTGANIEFSRGNYRLVIKSKPHPRDAADGWSGWTHRQKIRVGDYIAVLEKSLEILTEKEFKTFFVESEK